MADPLLVHVEALGERRDEGRNVFFSEVGHQVRVLGRAGNAVKRAGERATHGIGHAEIVQDTAQLDADPEGFAGEHGNGGLGQRPWTSGSQPKTSTIVSRGR